MTRPFLHEVQGGPEDLPAVAASELMVAWEVAGQAASAATANDDLPLGVRFRRADGEETRILFDDRDAGCWADAVDQIWGLDTPKGMALCFRLLGLVDLMAKAEWTRPLFVLEGGEGAEFHPALIKAAAALPLTRDARFDAERFRQRLGPALGAAGASRRRLTGG